MVPLVALLVLADVTHAPRTRPVECNVLPGERGANVWERAKIPELRHYCDVLASASAKLLPGTRLAADVVRLADQADALVPNRAAPLLLKGRALSLLGQHAAVIKALTEAHARDDRALEEPMALLAWARAHVATGDKATARAAYRELLPRADTLPLADRGVAYLGAGMLVLAEGPGSLDEATAILRQARRDSQDLLRAAATYELALALSRAGDASEASAVLTEEGALETDRVMTDVRVLDAMSPASTTGALEARAVNALALETLGKQDAARAAWRAYLDAGGAGGVWDAHARAHAGSVAKAGHEPPSRHP